MQEAACEKINVRFLASLKIVLWKGFRKQLLKFLPLRINFSTTVDPAFM
jgi:hypothetical protein